LGLKVKLLMVTFGPVTGTWGCVPAVGDAAVCAGIAMVGAAEGSVCTAAAGVFPAGVQAYSASNTARQAAHIAPRRWGKIYVCIGWANRSPF
jgi:hypothetical protein